MGDHTREISKGGDYHDDSAAKSSAKSSDYVSDICVIMVRVLSIAVRASTMRSSTCRRLRNTPKEMKSSFYLVQLYSLRRDVNFVGLLKTFIDLFQLVS